MQALFDLGGIWLQLAAALLIGSLFLGRQRHAQVVVLLSGLAALVHFLLDDDPGQGLGWVILFVVAAAIRLVMIILRSRSGITSSEERELLENVLRVEEPNQQRRLLDLVTWKDVEVGEVLMRQGQKQPPLIYIASGAAAIMHDGKQVGVCGAGDFLGEMSLITGEEASATVSVTNAMRIASFDRDTLMRLSTGMPELARAFDHALNRGLAAKVLRMNKATPAN